MTHTHNEQKPLVADTMTLQEVRDFWYDLVANGFMALYGCSDTTVDLSWASFALGTEAIFNSLFSGMRALQRDEKSHLVYGNKGDSAYIEELLLGHIRMGRYMCELLSVPREEFERLVKEGKDAKPKRG